MTISLVKGGNLSLTKAAPGLGAITVGLGWDARTTTGVKFDLDASALGVGEDGKVLSDQYFIFFNQRSSPEGAIEHQGDNRDGAGAGDDEVIAVNLAAIPPALSRSSSLPPSTRPRPMASRSARYAMRSSGC